MTVETAFPREDPLCTWCELEIEPVAQEDATIEWVHCATGDRECNR